MSISENLVHVDVAGQNVAREEDNAQPRTRLLLFTNSIGVGGMEEHVELLARLIDRQRFEVYAIGPDWPQTGAFTESLEAAADHFTKITPDRRYGWRSELINAYRFFRQVRAWRIQCMHMHCTGYKGQLWAFVAARLAGVKRIIVTEHLAPDNHLPWFSRQLRNVFSWAVDGLVSVSRKNYQARSTYLYTPPAHSYVVNNGVELTDFNPVPSETLEQLRATYNLPPTAKIVGTVVRFEPEKGLEYLLQAAPQIVADCPDAYFLMVGDGSLRKALEKQVADLGLTDRFRFVGFQSDPRPFLGLIDAFVLPVPVGSMSIGLLEAMAMKRAAVITFGGEGEAIIDGQSGLYAKPRDHASIAEAVLRILRDDQFRQSLGEAARRRIEDEFSAEQTARKLERIYLHKA